MKKFIVLAVFLFAFAVGSSPALATTNPPPPPSETPPEVKENCMQNGWESRTVIIDDVAYKFKNQGDCMSYLVTSDNVNVNEPAIIVE